MTNKSRLAAACDPSRLTLEHYENGDDVVVQHFRNVPPDDIGLEVDRCLGLGVRVMQIASPVVSLDEIHTAFGEMTEKQLAQLEGARRELNEELAATLTPLIGPEGTFQRDIKQAQRVMEQELRKYLDPENANSISVTVGKQVDQLLHAMEGRVSEAVHRAMDVTDESSGVGKVLRAIQVQKAEQAEQFANLVAQVSNAAGRRAERTTSTRKGADYEQAAFEEVSRVGSVHGDAVEPTGSVAGETGRKRGDITVALDDRITSGHKVCLTIEAMDRDHSKLGLRAVLKELEEAKENRSAQAAIALVSSLEVPAAGGRILQRHPGNLYVCVLDKESWDTLALEVAYAAARLDALAATENSAAGDIDLARASELVEDAMSSLGLIQRARTKLATSRGSMTDAEAILGELEGKLTGCLCKLSGLLAPEE